MTRGHLVALSTQRGWKGRPPAEGAGGGGEGQEKAGVQVGGGDANYRRFREKFGDARATANGLLFLGGLWTLM